MSGSRGSHLLAESSQAAVGYLLAKRAWEAGGYLLAKRSREGGVATCLLRARGQQVATCSPRHCQKSWLGWSHPSLYRMRPSDSNSGAGPPSESLTDSNSVALAFGHRV
ncbi:hypothetical protein PCANC_23164 [Puccinia coronata f. sp. avenae]|uniref:Uncharacterized protein n=1 Tax=Puccinia coronata f. sp. avenae TaxID=200324 RepID=A0A2N5SB32_9BASI|nr:hypothetical protein PCANC_23164 [Puccinia coronata f. sp. avenae]